MATGTSRRLVTKQTKTAKRTRFEAVGGVTTLRLYLVPKSVKTSEVSCTGWWDQILQAYVDPRAETRAGLL